MNRKGKVGLVSGYFNPIHKGHLKYIFSAKARCDVLIVIINNDIQVKVKGSKPFQDEKQRFDIVNQLKSVDYTFLSTDKDNSVANSLRHIHNKLLKNYNYDILFFNSGDRGSQTWNEKEKKVCEELSVECIYLDLPKEASSSNLIDKLIDSEKGKCDRCDKPKWILSV